MLSARLWLVVAVLSGGSLSGPTSAYAHPHDLLICGRAMTATLVSNESLPNGLFAEHYDTNNDGQTDVVTLSVILGYEHKPSDSTVQVLHSDHPLFYLVDRTADGVPDVILIDKSFQGACQDIVLYLDLRQLHHEDVLNGLARERRL